MGGLKAMQPSLWAPCPADPTAVVCSRPPPPPPPVVVHKTRQAHPNSAGLHVSAPFRPSCTTPCAPPFLHHNERPPPSSRITCVPFPEPGPPSTKMTCLYSAGGSTSAAGAAGASAGCAAQPVPTPWTATGLGSETVEARWWAHHACACGARAPTHTDAHIRTNTTDGACLSQHHHHPPRRFEQGQPGIPPTSPLWSLGC